jgi:hypothetical protein
VQPSVVYEIARTVGNQVLIAQLNSKRTRCIPDFLETVDRKDPAPGDMTLLIAVNRSGPQRSVFVLGASSKIPIE